jgi:glycosyltransferase involved in cell wall biosynthesis
MKVAILSMHDFNEVKGGTELFVKFLGDVFPGSLNVTYSMSKQDFISLDLSRFNLDPVKRGMAISRHLARLNRKEGFDLVICNDISGLGMKLFDPSIPAIQIFHYTYKGFSEGALRGKQGYYASRYLMPFFEKAGLKGKRVVAVSNKIKRELERSYGVGAQVIENAVDVERFSPIPQAKARSILGIDHDGPLGIFTGRADFTKGFDVLERLAETRRDIKILCVTGSQVKEDRLLLARDVPHERMPLYYSAADFLLFPSRYEASSYSVIEALSCDLPVVAYRTGIFEDMQEEQVGRLLDEVTLPAFSRGIDDLLKMPRPHPRAMAVGRFSLRRFEQEYKELARAVVQADS